MGGDCTSLPNFFDNSSSLEQFGETNFLSPGAASPDDIFSILEALDGVSGEFIPMTPLEESVKDGATTRLVSQKSTCSSALQELLEVELEELSPKTKKQKLLSEEEGGANSDGQQKVSHITVERNRRKQMNEHLTVLRSLMPCFYVKRGDQASIIGGVVDYITELQQVLQSLEAKKQRKVYSDVLSPRLVSSPRPLPISPRKPPISPRTPQPASPYRPRLPQPAAANSYLCATSMATTTPTSLDPSPCNSSSTSDAVNELVANSKSAIADVEVKFSGPNLLLKTISPRLPGQATKIISVLEELSLEILQASISTVDDTMVNTFTIKIGIECQLSAEDLAQHIQQTFT